MTSIRIKQKYYESKRIKQDTKKICLLSDSIARICELILILSMSKQTEKKNSRHDDDCSVIECPEEEVSLC